MNYLDMISESKIDIKKLDKNQYTISLLNESLRSGSESAEDVVSIQSEIMDLLKELIMRYTKGESTSVAVETAESLLNSILYTLDFYLLQTGNPEAAFNEMKEKGIKKIYDRGLELLRLCIIDTKRLYGKIKRNRLYVELDAYNDTIDEAIPAFFEKYNIVFSAHNAMASIDYPLAFDDMRVRGISYIKNYLEHLDIETSFCRLFSQEDINRLLIGFGRMCRLNHSIELINIFEILMNNSIFSVLCGCGSENLFISREQFSTANDYLKMKDINTVNEIINRAVEKLIEGMQIKNSLLIDYIDNYKEIFRQRFLNTLKNDCLDSFIIVEEQAEDKLTFTFSEGQEMSDKCFKIMINDIMEAGEIEDKLRIVNSNVHSLQDFIDLLNADCFFGKEYYYIFKTLPTIDLAVLSKIIFYEEIRNNEMDISQIIKSKKHKELEWQKYFIEFIDGLNADKKRSIENLMKKVECGEIQLG